MNRIKLMFALLASLILGACSSDDDNNAAYKETTINETPDWQIDWSNNQERPNWTAPDASLYENWTILMVKIEEALQPFVSKDDMMALFVNGELRGLAKPAVFMGGSQTGYDTFLMKAYGNETGTETVNMSLQYYNEKLHHIFTLSDDITLDSDQSTGIEEDYIPPFTSGSSKYPVVKTVDAEGILSKAGIPTVAGNIVAAFAGEECRGIATLSASGVTPLVVYGRSAGESLTLKYYNASTKRLFTIHDAVSL